MQLVGGGGGDEDESWLVGSQCVFNSAERCFHHFYLFFLRRQSARPSDDLKWLVCDLVRRDETVDGGGGGTCGCNCFSKALRLFYVLFFVFFFHGRVGERVWRQLVWSCDAPLPPHLPLAHPNLAGCLTAGIWACAGWPAVISDDWTTVNGRVTPLHQWAV